MTEQNQTDLKFYFDPACPWAWRTSLWIREVVKVRPVNLEWDFFSLTMINNQAQNLEGLNSPSEKGLRTLVLARRNGGNEAVDKLYLALGKARHENGAKLDDDAVVLEALKQAGLDENLLEQAMSDETTLEEINSSHNKVASDKAFGVPTLVLTQNEQTSQPIYGPVITQVPQGEEAGQLWDHFSWLAMQNDFYELKRNR